MPEETQKPRTASQRLDDLETVSTSFYQTLEAMARDILTIKEAIKLLGNKLDAVVKASNRGEQLNDDVISSIMVENNVEELKNKVTRLVSEGFLQATDIVEKNSFIVGKEINDNGEVANPRLQAPFVSLKPEVQEKVLGAKVGQVLDLEEGKWKLELTEIYTIVEAKPEEQPEASTEVKPEEVKEQQE